MTALMKIQSFIQAYVQAIASVLDADVTIVDNELVRVAGTGAYADEIGSTMTHGNFFNQILQSGENDIITDVLLDENCKVCEKRDTCRELANVAYPIFKDGVVVGIISIIAFDQEQREKLLQERADGRISEIYVCAAGKQALYG